MLTLFVRPGLVNPHGVVERATEVSQHAVPDPVQMARLDGTVAPESAPHEDICRVHTGHAAWSEQRPTHQAGLVGPSQSISLVGPIVLLWSDLCNPG